MTKYSKDIQLKRLRAIAIELRKKKFIRFCVWGVSGTADGPKNFRLAVSNYFRAQPKVIAKELFLRIIHKEDLLSLPIELTGVATGYSIEDENGEWLLWGSAGLCSRNDLVLTSVHMLAGYTIDIELFGIQG